MQNINSANNYKEDSSANSNIITNLNKIYESKGTNKQAWGDLLSMVNKTDAFTGIIYFFNQKIINEPSNPLTLDIIDFLIDFGPINLLREISKVDFMKNVFNLLKTASGSGLEVQKKGIYLTKKWNDKNNDYPNEKLEGFSKNCLELNNLGIALPPPGFK